MARIGLVLGAGGTVGGAFHSGVLAALEEATGWDARTAEVVVGTSAGSITGTGLRAGLSAADGYARSLDRRLSPAGARLLRRIDAVGAGGFTRTGRLRPRSPADVATTLARAATRPRTTRPGAVLASVAPHGVVRTDLISDGVSAFTDDRWPDDPLWICAVRQRDGRRVVFGRGERRPPLSDAVAASCAIPSFFAPVDVEGEPHVDGGAHSPTNADVLVREALDLVVVVSPMSIAGRGLRLAPDQPARRWARARLDAEARRLRRAGIPLLTFQPTAADAAVMAGNALDPAKRGPVASAAHASTLRRLEHPRAHERVGLLRSA